MKIVLRAAFLHRFYCIWHATADVLYITTKYKNCLTFDIVLIFFSYSGPSGVLGFDGKQIIAYADARGV